MIYTKEPFIVNEELCLALIDKRVTCDMELELKIQDSIISNQILIISNSIRRSYSLHPDINSAISRL